MIKEIILPLVTLLLVSAAIASTYDIGVAEELTLREMLNRHIDRLMRCDGNHTESVYPGWVEVL